MLEFLSSKAIFKSLSSHAFRKIDVDGNGKIDSGELYVGVLLCYSLLNQVSMKVFCTDDTIILTSLDRR